jgi:hypothetical protein
MPLVRKALAPALLLAVLVPLAAGGADIVKHYENSVIAEGETGAFSIEVLLPKEGPLMGVNAFEFIVHDREGKDVPGASVSVTPWMPEHNHGVSEKPVVTDRGGGAYTVGNVLFIMTGWWELTFAVRLADREDTVVINFPDVKASQHGSMDMPGVTTDVDTSTEADTDGGLFRVSYESSPSPPPLNALHAWTLTVRTAEGEPVTGAAIRVVGDMPEHGHGLPTEPEMTEETAPGTYLVEGVRFSMPGWWVMNFHIRAGDRQDQASFNVVIR